ncbi:MAG TPA: hypothetical protein VJ351_23500 [Streptosporangiaceae bacterium]|jgi:hypothetical protein|nr:hypothetical protein [Streptosporangiaceae bacterium]
MTAMPPEPDLSPQTSAGLTPPPSAWPEPIYAPPPPSPQDLAGPRRSASRELKGLRIATAVMWAAITVICAAGAVAELLVGIYAGAVVCLVVAVGAGWYDYRVWKRRARRLLL